MNTGRVFSRLYVAYCDAGFWAALREIHKGLLFRMYERVLNKDMREAEPLNTKAVAEICDLTVHSRHRDLGVEYTPTPYAILSWIFASLKIDYPEWHFIDVGSGRGRVVHAASRHPFKSVTGVEFAKELHEDAESFLASVGKAKCACGNIRLLHADATTFDVPPGPCAFFLFNPFGSLVVDKFLDHVLSSSGAPQCPMKFAYYNPVCANVFERRSQLVRRRKALFDKIKFSLLSPYGYHLYETRPA